MSQASSVDGDDSKHKSRKRPLTPAEIEIQQLVSLCRAGKLFAIQDWIAAGKPVNPPPVERKGVQRQSPLEVAIEHGFHSLVEVLLKAGADVEAGKWNGPMDRALKLRRLDIIQLLVEHGYDPTRIGMGSVFATWDSEIMAYFIDRGADLKTGDPVTEALKNRIRTALSVLKRDGGMCPDLQRQANAALRYHCSKGDLKWVSLMLWAGADPYDRGSELQSDSNEEDGEEIAALEYAVLYRHFDVFKIRGITWKVDHPVTRYVLINAIGHEEGLPLAEKLLKLGVNPNDPATGCCPGISQYLNSMSWSLSWGSHSLLLPKAGKIDSSAARQTMKAIHLLAKAGARWSPQEAQLISDARRSLVKLTPEYTLEFVWIMSRYKACTKDVIVDLVRTPTMKRHMVQHSQKLQDLLSKWEAPATDRTSSMDDAPDWVDGEEQ